jgi:hypothetical protein
MNTHAAIRIAKTDIQQILAVLALTPGLEVDDQLKLSMLEGETELNEIVSALLAENEDDEGTIEALKAQIEARKERKARLEARIDARKRAIMGLLDVARLTKLPLPEATLSVRTLGPRPKVFDEEAVPDDLCRFIRKPDMDAITAAFERGQPIPGVTVTNGGASLSVRRK